MLYKLAARCRKDPEEKPTSSSLATDQKDDGFRPAKLFSIDRVFRNETMDATHLAEFHQVEGVVADRNLTLADLIGNTSSLTIIAIFRFTLTQVSCEFSSKKWGLSKCASSLRTTHIPRYENADQE
jgi:hypothetical protein